MKSISYISEYMNILLRDARITYWMFVVCVLCVFVGLSAAASGPAAASAAQVGTLSTWRTHPYAWARPIWMKNVHTSVRVLFESRRIWGKVAFRDFWMWMAGACCVRTTRRVCDGHQRPRNEGIQPSHTIGIMTVVHSSSQCSPCVCWPDGDSW